MIFICVHLNRLDLHECRTMILKAKAKAKVTRYIPLETAAIFFLANLYLKQGIGLVYVIVDLICMGILELQGAEARITK